MRKIIIDLMNGQNLIYIRQSNNFIDKECRILNEVGYEEKLVYQNEILNDNDKYWMENCICNDQVMKIADEFRAGMQIFIKTIDNKIFTLEMDHSNKIRDVKMKIEEKTKLSANRQNLFCQGEILDDDNKTVDQYRICDKSVIDLVARLRGGMQVFAIIMDKDTFALELQKSDKIIDIKYKIQYKTGLYRDEQILIYQGGMLDDDKMIDSYQICENSVIYVVVRLRGGMQIFAKTMDGKTVALEVQRTDKIIDIKYKIQDKTGLHPDDQKLVFQGGILNDDKTIDEYQICENSVINVVARLRGGMQIFAKTMDGRIVEFEVQKTERISDIKKKIHDKTGLNPDEQKLVYQSKILNDYKTIDEYYQITDKSVVNVLTRFRNVTQIFAKTMDGKTVTLEVQKTDKIIDIKYKIEDKLRLHRNEQILIYCGNIMNNDKMIYLGCGILELLNENSKTIDEYQICEKSVINVVPRLRGGMQIFAKTMDGETFTLEIQKTYQIIDIKYKIQYKTGLHRDEQKLVYQGGILDDDKTVDECQIADKSVINVAKLKMEIFARTMNGKSVALELQKSDKIIDIKKKIEEKIGFHPDEQIIIYQGALLEGDNTIREYQICDQSVIDIVVRLKNEIQIFIQSPNKSTIPINIANSSKIIDIKSKIAEKTGIKIYRNNLIYENNILDNDKLLIDYHIDDGCVISIDGDSQILLFVQAIKSGSLERVKDLYDNIFHEVENDPYSPSPIHYACKQYNADIVTFLIENHFKIDVVDGEFNMPIHYACINGNVEILKILIQQKCNLDVSDARGMKPIHLACLDGNFPNVKLLIENHCDFESRDYLERQPIHLACLNRNINIVKLLIESKCEINVFDKSNKCPINIAEKENFIDIIEMLNEEISRRTIENMIKELNLKCDNNCDHKLCLTSLRNKTFNKGVKIKEGIAGKVYQCKLSQSSRQIAIKKISKHENNSNYIERNINYFIDKINHERIIKYFGAITKEENIFIFMEFMTGKSLRSKISINPPMISSKVINYTIQILEGLQFLHNNKIIHRNIKPDNILFDNDENVKLSDLGLGLLLCTTDGRTTQANTFCGTYYMAPEIINEKYYSYGADIWSLGVTVIEMATGKCPFQELSQQNVAVKIAATKTIPYQLPESSPINMKLFIDQMLLSEPSRRPSATDLINKFRTMK